MVAVGHSTAVEGEDRQQVVAGMAVVGRKLVVGHTLVVGQDSHQQQGVGGS